MTRIPDVVEDRERGQEHDEPVRHAPPEQGEHPDAEGDVRRHGDAPPSRAGPARVEGEEHRGGHDHPAQGRDRRQRRLGGEAQLADRELALDLHPDHEEEGRHEPVVHELEQREPDDGAPAPSASSVPNTAR
jgi:hypothetical protein